MLTLGIAEAKQFFFDRVAVESAVEKQESKQLSKIGAFIRRSALSSMKKRKVASAPGQPPRVIKGQLKKFTFFVFDPVTRSVVIGPALLNGSGGDAPANLEHGGETQGTVGWQWPAGHPRKGRKKKPVKKLVRIAARPYMWPAYLKNESMVPKVWKDCVRR